MNENEIILKDPALDHCSSEPTFEVLVKVATATCIGGILSRKER